MLYSRWNVWHGTQEPYQNWDQLAGRFVSEFGMQALPDPRTIDLSVSCSFFFAIVTDQCSP